jgi:hypothetical protein
MKKSEILIKDSDWKFAALVYLHLDLSEGLEEMVHFEETVIRIFKPSDIGLEHAYILELYCIREDYSDIIKAFHSLNHILNQFLDRLSLVTLYPCYVFKHLGITNFRAQVEEEFKLILFENLMIPQPKHNLKVSIGELIDQSRKFDQKEINDALREYRQGLESDSVFYLFLHHYNTIERIAEYRATEFVKSKCPKCGEEIFQPLKATGNLMREFFEKEGILKKDFNKIRAIRGKIAHGSGSRDKSLVDQIFHYFPFLTKVAGNLISSLSGLKVLYGKNPIANNQYIEIVGKKLSEKTEELNASYTIVSLGARGEFQFYNINDSTSNEVEDFRPFLGIPLDINPEDFKIHPYSWPY